MYRQQGLTPVQEAFTHKKQCVFGNCVTVHTYTCTVTSHVSVNTVMCRTDTTYKYNRMLSQVICNCKKCLQACLGETHARHKSLKG